MSFFKLPKVKIPKVPKPAPFDVPFDLQAEPLRAPLPADPVSALGGTVQPKPKKRKFVAPPYPG